MLLISDANILMDIEAGELVSPMFSLNYKFGVPDILYYEELEEQHGHLLQLGLEILTLPSEGVERVQALSQTYRKPSRNDLFALALAEMKKCPLLTGDSDLKIAATSEKITVNGTIWLLNEMIRECRITKSVGRLSIQKMRKNGRRLPWDIAEKALSED